MQRAGGTICEKKKRRGLSGDTRRGRFELRETEHYSLFEGRTYHTRECVFTPEDDARGLCSEVPTAIYVPEEIKQEGRWQPRVTGRGKTAACENVSSRHAYSRYFKGDRTGV